MSVRRSFYTQGAPLLLLALALAGGCTRNTGVAPRTTSSPNVITRRDIEQVHVSTAYEAIERLRPEFLRSRGVRSMRGETQPLPVVYINGIWAGEPVVLRGINAAEVEEIRFLGAADATTRYGTGHAGGALQVRLSG